MKDPVLANFDAAFAPMRKLCADIAKRDAKKLIHVDYINEDLRRIEHDLTWLETPEFTSTRKYLVRIIRAGIDRLMDAHEGNCCYCGGMLPELPYWDADGYVYCTTDCLSGCGRERVDVDQTTEAADVSADGHDLTATA
jgi:hypothetical protein